MNTEHSMTAPLPQTEQSSEAAPATLLLHGDVYDQKVDSLTRRVGQYLKSQPALLLTGSYLFCSLLGLIFVVALFNKFDFAVLPYLEISDFLLAALSNPWTILQFILWTLGVVTLLWLDRAARQRFRSYARFSDRFYKPRYQRISLYMFATLPMVFLIDIALLEAISQSKALKAGTTPRFNLSLIYPVFDDYKTMQMEQIQIIARSVSYLFVYHQGKIKVIPHANVAGLFPLPAAKADNSKAEPNKAKSEPAANPAAKNP